MPTCSAWHKRAAATGAAAAGALLPQDASAHSPVPGFEGFYTGLLHPVATPEQLLALLAVGVMLGFGFREGAGIAWLAFSVSALLGICLGQFGFAAEWHRSALLALAVLAATIAAIRPAGHRARLVLFAGLGGLLIGLASTPDPGPWRATVITLAGSFVGANLIFLYLGGGVFWLQMRFPQLWMQIGVRIAAAWIAAISMIMGSLTLAVR